MSGFELELLWLQPGVLPMSYTYPNINSISYPGWFVLLLGWRDVDLNVDGMGDQAYNK